jgi:hypothetical protein
MPWQDEHILTAAVSGVVASPAGCCALAVAKNSQPLRRAATLGRT